MNYTAQVIEAYKNNPEDGITAEMMAGDSEGGFCSEKDLRWCRYI